MVDAERARECGDGALGQRHDQAVRRMEGRALDAANRHKRHRKRELAMDGVPPIVVEVKSTRSVAPGRVNSTTGRAPARPIAKLAGPDSVIENPEGPPVKKRENHESVDREARALWYVTRGRAELRPVVLPPPGPEEALVRTLWSGLSRGTERLVFEGRVPFSDGERMRAPFQEGT